MTTIIDLKGSVPEAARSDLQARVEAAFKACEAARARNDLVAADRHWHDVVGLLEVQMGRTSSAEKLTMTPAVPATR